MHSRAVVLALAASMAGGAIADKMMMVNKAPAALFKRQEGSQAFTADVETAVGDTCEEAWGPGSIDCGPPENNLCYNPGEGQSCCENTYHCPAESFCLTDDKCCPNGLDPATCAAQNGITLPEGFSATTTGGSTYPTSHPSAEVNTTTYPTTTASGIVYPTDYTRPNGSGGFEMFTGAAAKPHNIAAAATGGLLVAGIVAVVGSLL